VDATINGDARYVERLSIYLAVRRHGEKLAELVGVHITRVQDRFGRVLSGSRIVIVLRQYGDLSEGRHYNRAEKNEYTKTPIDVEIENDTNEACEDSDERRLRFPHRTTPGWSSNAAAADWKPKDLNTNAPMNEGERN